MRRFLRSRRWALGYGLALALLTAFPYALAWQHQGNTWRFSGLLAGVGDGNSYLAKMLLGAHGAWLFRPPYATWRVPPLPVFGFYVWLGKLAAGKALHLQLALLFHWARLVGIVVWVWAVYAFVGLFIAQEWWRRWAVVLATLGSGLGWLLMPWVRLSWAGALCFYSPETYGFLGAFLLPHLLWAWALLFLALRRVLTARHRRHAWQAVGLVALLAWVHPVELVPFLAAVGAWGGVWAFTAWRQGKPWPQRVRLALWPWGSAAALAGGYWALFRFQPYLRAWASQEHLVSPPFWQYLLAYAWLLPFAWWGRRYWARGGPRKLLPWLWILALPVLLYAPVGMQRRLASGVWVAWAAVAAAGLAVASRTHPRRARGAGMGMLALAAAPALLLTFNLAREAVHPAPPAFLPAAEVQAFHALAEASAPGDGVLAAFPTANALPAWAPVRVVNGLGSESPSFASQQQAVARFFSTSTDDAWRLQFLRQNRLHWVFWGAAERALGTWQPDSAAFLCRRYAEAGYAFYEVCP